MLGLHVEEAARDTIDIINNTMFGAIRFVLVERGHEPHDFMQRGGCFDIDPVARVVVDLMRDAVAWPAAEGMPEVSRSTTWHASLCYEDQGSELTQPWA
jgi:hypothetical protein